MGLLDMNDEQNQGLLAFGLNMLRGAGPSTQKQSLGQIFGTSGLLGMQAYQDASKNKREQEKEKMQMDMLKQQVAQATRKNSLINDMMSQYGMSNQAGQALSSGAAVGDVGPTNTNAARIGQGQPSMNGIPREAIAHDLAFNDGKNVSEWLFKRGTPDMQVSNGYAYDKNNLKSGFLPGLSTSQDGKSSLTTVDPATGLPRISVPPGALEAFGAYQQGQKTVEAQNDLVTLNLPTGPVQVTRAQALKMTGGMPQQPAPSQTMTPPNWQQINTNSRAGQPGRDGERLAVLQQERSEMIQQGAAPHLIAAIDREIVGAQGSRNPFAGAQAGQVGPGFGIPLQSEAQKKLAEGRVQNQLDREKEAPKIIESSRSAITKANDAIKLLDKAIDHPGRKAVSGASGTLDIRNYMRGTDGTNFKVLLDQIQGKAFLEAFESLKGAGQITEIEGKKATDAIARLNTAQSDKEFESALTDFKSVVQTAKINAEKRLVENGGKLDASKTWKDYGYSSPQDAIKEARNALLRNPSAKAEILRRLEESGITQHGLR